MLGGWGRILGAFLGGPLGSLCRPPGVQKIGNALPKGESGGLGRPGGQISQSGGHSHNQQDGNRKVFEEQAFHLRRGIQLSAVLGLAFNLFHSQLRIRALGKDKRFQEWQLCPGLGIRSLGSECKRGALPSVGTEEFEAHANCYTFSGTLTTEEVLGQKERPEQKGFVILQEVNVEEQDNITIKPLDDNPTEKESKHGDPISEVEMEIMAMANTHVAVQLVMDGHKEEGMELLLKAAKHGNSEAMFNLGVLYEQEGREKQALRFYEASSRLNYSAAFFNLGVFHEHGKAGLCSSTDKAKEYYMKAAELGLEEAIMVMQGFGIHFKPKKRKASDTDKPTPKQLYHLARAYHFGTSGVAVDKPRAAELYRLAANGGYRKARNSYRELLRKLLESTKEDALSNNELMIGTHGF